MDEQHWGAPVALQQQVRKASDGNAIKKQARTIEMRRNWIIRLFYGKIAEWFNLAG